MEGHVDISPQARMLRFQLPVYVTDTVYASCIRWTSGPKDNADSRTLALLRAAAIAVSAHDGSRMNVMFSLWRWPNRPAARIKQRKISLAIQPHQLHDETVVLRIFSLALKDLQYLVKDPAVRAVA